jgi:hypothetical protein
MFKFSTFSETDWMAYAGADSFADGRDPMISSGDVAIDGAPADIILDGRGLQIVWTLDDDTYCLMAEGVDAMRLLALLQPAMTYAGLAALPGGDDILKL